MCSYNGHFIIGRGLITASCQTDIVHKAETDKASFVNRHAEHDKQHNLCHVKEKRVVDCYFFINDFCVLNKKKFSNEEFRIWIVQ